MKKGYMMIACCALLTGLGSCATDDALNGGGNENGLTDVGTNYLAFNIVSDAGGGSTRAWPDEVESGDNFDKDEIPEQAIATSGNYAVFFNQDNTFHSIVELGVEKLSTSQDVSGHGDNKEVSVGKFIANIKIDNGQTPPAKVLILLNARPYRITEIETEFSKPMKERTLSNPNITPVDDVDYMLSCLTREMTNEEIEKANASVVLYTPGDGEGGKTNYCIMSNAVYVGSGTEQTGQVYNITEIGPNIYDTAEKAAASPLTIHVERLAVKVETTIKGMIGSASASDGATYAWTTDDGKMQVTVYGKNNDDLYAAGDRMMYPIVMEPQHVEGVEDEVNQVNPDGTATNTDVKPVKWAFSMLGWSVNGTVRRTYLVKNLNDKREDMDGETDESPHHNEITSSGDQGKIDIPFFSNWNDANRFRCYWAVDGRYADPDIYPVQYRKAMDNTNTATNSFVGKYDGPEDGSPLYYYSFSQLRQLAYGFAPNPGVSTGGVENMTKRGNLLRDTRYRYCAENVLGQRLLAGNTYLGASTHVIIIGQLLLGEEIENYKEAAKEAGSSTVGLLERVHDKFYADGCYWDRESYMQWAYSKIYNALVTGDRIVKDIFSTSRQDFTTPAKQFAWYYKKNGDESEKPLSATHMKELAATSDMNAVEDNLSPAPSFNPDGFKGKDDDQTGNIFRLVRAKTTNGDGRVMLGLKDGYTLVLKGTDGNGEPVSVDVSETQFLGMVYEFAGLADYYAKGRMYYYTPIRHVTTPRENNEWQLGDIGIVRNHWYRLEISSLLKPGIPVAEPDQPIIPNIDPADMYIGVDIHILPWHVIKQEVTLQ